MILVYYCKTVNTTEIFNSESSSLCPCTLHFYNIIVQYLTATHKVDLIICARDFSLLPHALISLDSKEQGGKRPGGETSWSEQKGVMQ